MGDKRLEGLCLWKSTPEGQGRSSEGLNSEYERCHQCDGTRKRGDELGCKKYFDINGLKRKYADTSRPRRDK